MNGELRPNYKNPLSQWRWNFFLVCFGSAWKVSSKTSGSYLQTFTLRISSTDVLISRRSPSSTENEKVRNLAQIWARQDSSPNLGEENVITHFGWYTVVLTQFGWYKRMICMARIGKVITHFGWGRVPHSNLSEEGFLTQIGARKASLPKFEWRGLPHQKLVELPHFFILSD